MAAVARTTQARIPTYADATARLFSTVHTAQPRIPRNIDKIGSSLTGKWYDPGVPLWRSHRFRQFRDIFEPFAKPQIGDGNRLQAQLWDIAPGCILWLPQKEFLVNQDIRTHNVSDEGFQHAVVVIDVHIQGPTSAIVSCVSASRLQGETKLRNFVLTASNISGGSHRGRAEKLAHLGYQRQWGDRLLTGQELQDAARDAIRRSTFRAYWSSPWSPFWYPGAVCSERHLLCALIGDEMKRYPPADNKYIRVEAGRMCYVDHAALHQYRSLAGFYNAKSHEGPIELQCSLLDAWYHRLDKTSYKMICSYMNITPSTWIRSGPEMWKNYIRKSGIDPGNVDLEKEEDYDFQFHLSQKDNDDLDVALQRWRHFARSPTSSITPVFVDGAKTSDSFLHDDRPFSSKCSKTRPEHTEMLTRPLTHFEHDKL